MLRRIYYRTLALAAHRHALWWLAAVAFIESSVFPIPPDILLIPMVIATPRRAWLIAGVATAASVAGGAAGYALGMFAYDLVAPLLEFYGYAARFESFRVTYNEWGAWAVLVAGITPFPYKVITILSGATGLHFGVFMVASVAARGVRFFVVAALLWKFGTPIRGFIERRLGLVFSLSLGLLVGGFLILKVL